MSDFLDNLLSRGNEDALRFHLNGCPRCSLKMDDMKSAIRAVKSLTSLAPTPEFDHQLGSNLTEEIAHDLYAASWRRRLSEGYAELLELSQQRPIRVVFATSLILTIALFWGTLLDSSEQSSPELVPAISSLPKRFEPEHEPLASLAPLPLEHELAPRMVIKPLLDSEPISKLASFAPTSSSFNQSRLTNEAPGVRTVRTMEPKTYGMRTVSAVKSLRLAPSLSAEYFGRGSFTIDQLNTEERVESVGSGIKPTPQKLTSPSAPLKRIRISF